MTDKKNKGKKSNLEALLKNDTMESADRLKQRDPATAIIAVKSFYDSIEGLDKKDALIGRAIQEALVGVQSGSGISNAGILQNIGLYSNKYKETKATVADYVEAAEIRGYNLPDEVKEGLVLYMDYTLEQLKEMAEKDKDEGAYKAFHAVQAIEEQKLTAEIPYKLRTEATTNGLLGLYKLPEEPQEQEEE